EPCRARQLRTRATQRTTCLRFEVPDGKLIHARGRGPAAQRQSSGFGIDGHPQRVGCAWKLGQIYIPDQFPAGSRPGAKRFVTRITKEVLTVCAESPVDKFLNWHGLS